MDIRGAVPSDLGKSSLDQRPSVALVMPQAAVREMVEAENGGNPQDQPNSQTLSVAPKTRFRSGGRVLGGHVVLVRLMGGLG